MKPSHDNARTPFSIYGGNHAREDTGVHMNNKTLCYAGSKSKTNSSIRQ